VGVASFDKHTPWHRSSKIAARSSGGGDQGFRHALRRVRVRQRTRGFLRRAEETPRRQAQVRRMYSSPQQRCPGACWRSAPFLASQAAENAPLETAPSTTTPATNPDERAAAAVDMTASDGGEAGTMACSACGQQLAGTTASHPKWCSLKHPRRPSPKEDCRQGQVSTTLTHRVLRLAPRAHQTQSVFFNTINLYDQKKNTQRLDRAP
jgi:hypothetical protein